jgi:DNA-binding HxlR family transcriptional regulator
MNPYASLSEAERIRQIGDLLATAAIRYLREKDQQLASRQAERPPSAPIPHVWDLVDDEMEKQVLRYLSLHVATMPADMGKALNLSSMTLTRRLARLRDVGLVVVSGKTRKVSYSIASDACRN